MTAPLRVRIPAPAEVLRFAPNQLAPLLSARIGERLIGIEADGGEAAYEVVAVARDDGPCREDSVARDQGAGTLTIAICSGPYDAATGGYGERSMLRCAPARG